MTGTLPRRFWAKVAVADPDACWEWTGAKWANGYGVIGLSGSRNAGAHRVSLALSLGLDVAQLGSGHVCHTCDNPGCVNPKHLFLGSRQDNVSDMWSKDRGKYPFRTHCQRGHELAVTGIYHQKDGRRRCRQCHIDRQAAWEMKQKERRAAA